VVMRAGLIATALACLALAGCSGDRDTGEGRKIEAVVKHFALSDGPGACSLMTTKAVTQVYGGRSDCVARSKAFAGEAVDVTFVKISSSTGAHATAKTPDGRRYWTVGLHKQRGRWLIDSIARAQQPN
jgi:hypothetical protein